MYAANLFASMNCEGRAFKHSANQMAQTPFSK